ncbi:rhs element Vgr protein, partial [Escherichia coli PA34]
SSTVRLITISCAGWRRRKASSFMRSMLTKVPTRAWCCATRSAICPNLLKSPGTRTPVPR